MLASSRPSPTVPSPAYRPPSSAEYPATPLSCKRAPVSTSTPTIVATIPATAPSGPSAPRRHGPRVTAQVSAATTATVTALKIAPAASVRHHGTASATSAAGSVRDAATSSTSRVSTSRGGIGRGPRGPAYRRARRRNGTSAANSTSCATASTVRNPPVTRRCAPASRSASASRETAVARSLGRPAMDTAGCPANSFSGTGRFSAVSAVGARSVSCRYPGREVLDEVSQPAGYPGPSAMATCSREVRSVSDRPATSTSDRAGRAASTRASAWSACRAATWRSCGEVPMIVPRSTIDRMQVSSSAWGRSGSAAWYRSTRPDARAAATAAPGPTAAVHRTASASAPGWAP